MIPTNTGSAPLLRIVVLAAGFAQRLGRPKPLVTVRGMSLLVRMLRTLEPFRAYRRIIVVVPPRTGARLRGARHAVQLVANPRRAEGLSSSVRLGLGAAARSAGVLILPVDLVALSHRDVKRLVARWRGSRRKVTARRTPAGAATPLILPRWLKPRADSLAGDQGLRDLVRNLPARCVALIDMPSAAADVDTPEDLKLARRRARATNPQTAGAHGRAC